MKRIFCIILCIFTMACLLTGCGGSKIDVKDDTILKDFGTVVSINGNDFNVLGATIESKNVDEENKFTSAVIAVKAENDAATANAKFEMTYHYNGETKKMEGDDCELIYQTDAIIKPRSGLSKEVAMEYFGEEWTFKEIIDDLENSASKSIFTKTTSGKYGSITETATQIYNFDTYSLEWVAIKDGKEIEVESEWNIEGKWLNGTEEGMRYGVWGDDLEIEISNVTDNNFHMTVNWPSNGGVIFDDNVEYDAYTDAFSVNVEHPEDGWDTFDMNFYMDELLLLYNSGLVDKEIRFSLETEIPETVYVIPPDTDFTYTLDEENKTATINSYVGEEKFLKIPDKIEGEYVVVAINDNSFVGNKATLIQLPETIEYIGDGAFKNSKLREINIPNSVKYIGEKAFYECANIYMIDLPTSLESLGEYAFSKTNIVSIELPDGLTSLAKGVFYYCDHLTSVTLNENLLSIGDNAFDSCKKLKSITIPGNVKTIGKSAFESCIELENVVFESGVEVINDYAFKVSAIKTLILPDSVTALGVNTFAGSDGLEFVKLSKNIQTIPYGCFAAIYGTTSAVTLYIPEGVETIDAYAFHGWENLNKVSLPKSLKTVKENAFENCSKLTTVYYSGSEADWNNIDIDDGYGVKSIREGNKKWNTTGDLENLEP